MVFILLPRKEARHSIRLRTLLTAPLVALRGVWRLHGSFTLATKDMEVSKTRNQYDNSSHGKLYF